MDVDFFMHEHEQNIYDTLEADEPVLKKKKKPLMMVLLMTYILYL